ncbi:MAG: membrane protein insertion efficiency factor YidD [bacterium]|nr:membrane protein insertion efficiency factor YidD [bacterium]
MRTLSKTATNLIELYQKTVSPDHGIISLPFLSGSCKYYPSCSTYTKQAIQTKGFLKGIARSAWRIMRCNPFSQGGYDPV